MAALTPQDRLILMMRFNDDRTVSDIARQLQLKQKPLYRHIERLLLTLRDTFQSAGLDAATVIPLMESWTPDLDWSSTAERTPAGPSIKPGAHE